MQKIEIKLKESKFQAHSYGGKNIEIKNFISLAEETVIIDDYLENYFEVDEDSGDVSYEHGSAEFALMTQVIDVFTNIKVTEEDGGEKINLVIDVASGDIEGLFGVVSEAIGNYGSFRARLDRTVCDAKEILSYKRSLESKVNGLLENVSSFLLKIAEDITSDNIENIKESLTSLAKEVEDSPLKGIMEEVK